MQPQDLVNIIAALGAGLFAIIGAGVTWWVNNIWSMVKTLQTDVSNLHVELVKNYVPRSELQAAFDRIFDTLEDIRKEVKK